MNRYSETTRAGRGGGRSAWGGGRSGWGGGRSAWGGGRSAWGGCGARDEVGRNAASDC